ncbi:MAG: hypothetical protein R2748_00920 [Bryobacterales bacterium]
MQGEIDATAAAQALAAAELVSAARGHAPDDLPDDAIPLVKGLKKPAATRREGHCPAAPC